jgi:hypothetical protein
MRQTFLEPEVGEVVGAELVAQEGGELLVLLEEAVFPVGPKDVMAMLDLLQGGVQLAAQPAGEPGAEDFRDLVGGQAPQPQLTTALEQAMDREVALEDEIAAILDLADGVEAPQVHGGSLAPGELGAQHQGPIFQALPNHFRRQAVRGSLQGFGIVHGQEGVVVFAEGDALPVQFVFEEAVGVQTGGGLKGKEAGHAHDHRSQDRIAEVEVVVSEAAALPGQDAIVRVGGRVLGGRGPEGRALLQAFQNEVDPVLVPVLHATQGELKIVLLPHPRLRPFDGDVVVAGEGLDPVLVVVRPMGEDLFGDRRHAYHLAEDVDHLLGARQPREIPVDDKAIKTVIHKQQQASKKACKKLHRSSSSSCLSNKIFGETTDGVKISNIFG